MKQTIKKLTSAALALAMGISMAGNVFANEIEETEYVQVAGYTCTVEDGQYYTEIDGERYLLINLDDLTPSNYQAPNVCSEEKNTLSFEDKREIYSDTVNLTNGNYTSPHISCNSTHGFIMHILKPIASETVYLNFHYFMGAYGWDHAERGYVFNIFYTDQIIFTGAQQLISECYLEIYKDKTTLGSPFSYGLYEY